MTELRGLPVWWDEGRIIELDGDVLGIVQQVHEISPRVHIYYNEQTGGFDFTETSLDGSSERLIFSVAELDQRAVSSLRMADQWRGREDPTHVLPPDEDFLSIIDRDNEATEKEKKEQERDKLYAVGERMAHALGEDRRGVDAEAHLRVKRVEAAEPRHQPARGKGGRDRDDQRVRCVIAGASDGAGQLAEAGGEARREDRAELGRHQPARRALEYRAAELLLGASDLLADRALRDAKLVRRACEAFVAGSGLEGLERIERRQPARHPTLLHEKF